jgi:hypothetical protein
MYLAINLFASESPDEFARKLWKEHRDLMEQQERRQHEREQREMIERILENQKSK